MSHDSEIDSNSLRANLIRLLKMFTLSYQQQQLLKNSELGLLARHIVNGRRMFTYALVAISVLSLYQGATSGFPSVLQPLWLVVAGVTGAMAYFRIRNSRALIQACHAYELSKTDIGSDGPSLSDELRLNFPLVYFEYQALNAGNDVIAAERIIARYYKNSSLIASAASGIALHIYKEYGLAALPIISAIATVVIVCLVRVYTLVRRVKSILRRHIDESV